MKLRLLQFQHEADQVTNNTEQSVDGHRVELQPVSGPTVDVEHHVPHGWTD